jgi:hypothetical protein
MASLVQVPLSTKLTLTCPESGATDELPASSAGVVTGG